MVKCKLQTHFFQFYIRYVKCGPYKWDISKTLAELANTANQCVALQAIGISGCDIKSASWWHALVFPCKPTRILA